MRHAVRLVGIVFGALALVAAAASSAVPANDAQRIERALAALEAQRPGVVDAYLVVVALDTDPVFGREAREAGRVLARRFGAQGRTVVLASDEGGDQADAAGSPQHLAMALARITALMDGREDVLILYATSHGTPRAGLNFKDPARGTGIISPGELAAMLSQNGIENRLIIIQACFSGQFVPALAAPGTVVVTAASAMQPSFGCTASNDWTFFGHALVNQAMRRPDPFVRQFRRAWVTIDGWERRLGLPPSDPQISVGSATSGWLAALDAHAPLAKGEPVGRPPMELGL